ncbi:Proline iminopeptidase 1 [Phlyctema vagabunda]|uniref:Proline iminopeptidase 1 n=1 Tax=Phlyctema vagabunda TaxID=108571 RepID=A0ABR4P736_9HELO
MTIMAFARLLETKSHLIPGRLSVSELRFEVPKDYSNPSAGTIQVFARSVTRHESPTVPLSGEEAQSKSQKPWFVYLQGGPGSGCPPPQNYPLTNAVLEKGYQMLYMDQRGTGLSTPVSAATLALQGDAQKQADYLKLFRADNIVRDAEAIRKTLTKDYPAGLKKWSIFGQSYGGFCALTYLSRSPQGLREVFTAGGLAPVGRSAEEVYQATYRKVIERGRAYYTKYPEDIEIVQDLAFHIKSQGGIQLPSGATLTVRVFLTLGRAFGMHSGIDLVHDHVYRMKSDLEQFGFITRPTLSALESSLTIDDTVIYAILHESIYCEGTASRWAADRVGKALKEFQWLSPTPSSPTAVRATPLYWSGEMIYPFMFENSRELERIRPAAEILAEYSEWPPLYDEWQLARNEVPVYAATYLEDMYVDFGLAQETAKKVKNCKQFITNIIYHDGARTKNEEVMKQLFALRDDSID